MQLLFEADALEVLRHVGLAGEYDRLGLERDAVGVAARDAGLRGMVGIRRLQLVEELLVGRACVQQAVAVRVLSAPKPEHGVAVDVGAKGGTRRQDGAH